MIKWSCGSCDAIIKTKNKPPICICGSTEISKLNQEEIDSKSVEEIRQNLSKHYEDIKITIQKYMDMPKDQIKLVAIWIIGTYFHEAFTTYPFLFLNAMRGSGKTRLLRIISYLAKNAHGRVHTGITESVIFRMPKGDTLVLDELESIGGKEKQSFREYMNACYKRGGVVQRMKKSKVAGQEEWVIDNMEPFKPIAMANIWGMEEVLGDRCISFVLEKSNNPAKTKKAEDFEQNLKLSALRGGLNELSVVCVLNVRKKNTITAWNSWIEEKYNDITTYTTHTTHTTHTTQQQEKERKEEDIIDKIEMDEMFRRIDELEIDGRNLELLMPLLLVAKIIGSEVFEEFLLIGKDIMRIKKEEEFTESRDVSVYEFVSKQQAGLSFIPVKELTARFRIYLGSDEEWINEKWLGRALKRLNLLLDSTRQASGKIVRLNVSKAGKMARMFGGKK